MAKKKSPSKEAVRLAKKVHKAIHPIEHEKLRKNSTPVKELTPMQRKMRKAELLRKKAQRMAAAAAAPAREITRAKKEFEEFTGLRAENVTRAGYKAPKVAIVLGRLVSVVYEAERLDVEGYEGENGPALYEHKFSKKNPPILASSTDGGQLIIVGGGYYFDAKKGGIIG